MKLLLLAFAMASAAGPPAAQPAPGRLDVKPAPSPSEFPLPPGADVMPVVGDEDRPGCRSYRRQVADRNKLRSHRLADIRTLDREPAGHAFLAVDRRVDGCPELTFLHGRAPTPDEEKPRP